MKAATSQDVFASTKSLETFTFRLANHSRLVRETSTSWSLICGMMETVMISVIPSINSLSWATMSTI